MNALVTVANVTTALIEYMGQPVCTTRQLSKFYGCGEDNLADNFRKNAERFEEGKHFVKLEGEALRQFKAALTGNNPVSPNTRNLILWTEKGAARHAKMLSTDKAWEIFEQLEDVYFRVKQAAHEVLRSEPLASGLPQYRKARALDMATRAAERICAQFPKLCDSARQVVFAKMVNPVAGDDVIALPALTEQHYSAGKVGEQLGVSANAVGRLANTHGLKTAEYGEFRLDKSPYSAKQVESFYYNARGVEKLAELVGEQRGGGHA